MASNTVVPAAVEADTEVMAAVEDGLVEQFILADVTTDEAYLTMPLTEAASLPEWR